MENLLSFLSGLLWDWPLLVLILSTGIYFTVSSGFFQFKYFKHIFQNTIMSKSNRDDSESITPKPIETFYSAVATTAGIGNITGVATAITFGGPGALFWLIVTGFIGMIIKMAEVTLAVYYRDQTEDGYFESSPMHYIEKGIGKGMNFGSLKIPIYLFAIGLFSTVPFTIQNYYASVSISSSLNIPALAVSLVYAAIVYITIFKGISSYGKVMKNIFPIVILIYIASGILVILFNMSYIIPSIKLIFQDAFNFGSITGGIAGKSIAEVMKQGISRGLYSNESGWGTSPMLHSQADTDHPVKLGLWGVIEVFIDTIVICVTTGIVVVIAISAGESSLGYELVVEAFSLGIGSLSNIVVPITIFIFGLTATVGWYFYSAAALKFIFRSSKNVSTILKGLRLVYPLGGVFNTIYFLNQDDPTSILWSMSEIILGFPIIINMFAILVLSNKFFDLLKDYELKYITGGPIEEENPIFYEEEDISYFNY